MAWRWTRAQPEPLPDPVEDEVSSRLRELAGQWHAEAGRDRWADLLGEPTSLLPVVTPAAQRRGRGADG